MPEKDKDCEHNFVFMRNESWYRKTNNYYGRHYVSIDHFYCNKCLAGESKKQEAWLESDQRHNYPDWARTITNAVS